MMESIAYPGRTQAVRRKPDIVYASLNAFGHLGPWAGRPGHEQFAQAATAAGLDFVVFLDDFSRLTPEKLQSLAKGSLERSLFSRDHGAWDKGLEHRAMNAAKLVSQGLTPEQVQKFQSSQVPAERVAAQAWLDGGGTVQGAQQQIASAISQIDQADANGNGRVGPKEGQQLTGSAAALFQATTALRGRF